MEDMKTRFILFITFHPDLERPWQKREEYIDTLCMNLEESLNNATVRYTTYNDLVFTVRSDGASIVDARNKIDLRDCAFVHFKNRQFRPEEATVAFYLRQHQVLFYSSEVDTGISAGKIAQMFRLNQVGLPVPDSFYAHRSYVSAMFAKEMLPDNFAFPLIIKANSGTRGEDNHLVHSFDKAREALAAIAEEKQVILQNFIANDGDYRFLFIGLDAEPLVFKRSAIAGSHLNNTSKGATGTFLDPTTLPRQYGGFARRAAEVLRREIGGVDIVVDKHSGKPYILEVNGTPAIATGFGQSQKVKKYAAFLTHLLDGGEEE